MGQIGSGFNSIVVFISGIIFLSINSIISFIELDTLYIAIPFFALFVYLLYDMIQSKSVYINANELIIEDIFLRKTFHKTTDIKYIGKGLGNAKAFIELYDGNVFKFTLTKRTQLNFSRLFETDEMVLVEIENYINKIQNLYKETNDSH
jgi:hypothetical protein